MKKRVGAVLLAVGGVGVLAGLVGAIMLFNRMGTPGGSFTFMRVEWLFAVCAISSLLLFLGRVLSR
jgi:hypothetical protein